MRILHLSSLTLIMMLVAACSTTKVEQDGGPKPGTVDVSAAPDAVPRVEPKSKQGNMKSYEVFGKRYHVMESSKGFVQRGIASWYGKKFHGRKTSNGETYDMYAMSAAHKELPLPTYLQVKNLKNGREVVVRVNDRGPFHENRIIDLSYTAASKLDIIRTGTGLVEIRAIDPGSYRKGGAPVTNQKGGAPVIDGIKKEQTGGFYIQVGAFSRFLNAKKLKDKLQALGRRIRIAEAIIDNKPLYKVQIGPMDNIDVADDVVNELRRYGVFDHHIALD